MMQLRVVPDVLSDRPTFTVAADAPIVDAARWMRDLQLSAGYVVDSDDALIGLITERDIVRRLVAESQDAATTPVSAVMRPTQDQLAPGDLAIDAVDLMDIRDVECLPVVDDGEVLGIVTLADLCDVLRNEVDITMQQVHDPATRPEPEE